jgi:hypothetical protein
VLSSGLRQFWYKLKSGNGLVRLQLRQSRGSGSTDSWRVAPDSLRQEQLIFKMVFLRVYCLEVAGVKGQSRRGRYETEEFGLLCSQGALLGRPRSGM